MSVKSYVILVCNTNSADATASIFIREQDSNNSSAARNDISIVKNVLVPGNTSIEIIDGGYPIYYRKGEPYYDHVMAFGSTTGIDIIMGYQKIDWEKNGNIQRNCSTDTKTRI